MRGSASTNGEYMRLNYCRGEGIRKGEVAGDYCGNGMWVEWYDYDMVAV